ncbi:MAG: LysR family transcriptional regulator [Bacteroidaceae bacterium]|nr:LysR family transcriptional regulator [Bacteroidaceae bacterium]
MTLQQLKYIIAIFRHGSFAKAAAAEDISQPTLSAMLAKLEDELDVRLFERNNKGVKATPTGECIVRQAEKVIAEAERITELVDESKQSVTGTLALAISPNIAPYILPRFIRHYMADFPQIQLTVQEMKAEDMSEALQRRQADAGIAIGGIHRQGLLEIPLYTERFMVYLSESCWRKLPVFSPDKLEHENMWIMKDAQCLRESAFSFCKARTKGKHIYEAGSIETLIRIVDLNGGFTIIPEMHLPMLTEAQRRNVRRIEGDYLSQRRVSLYIDKDYVRERLLGTITDTLLKFMPQEMMSPGIVKFGIRL